VGEIGEACGVFRRTYEDIGVFALFSARKVEKSSEYAVIFSNRGGICLHGGLKERDADEFGEEGSG
jgi:hypothetical protein